MKFFLKTFFVIYYVCFCFHSDCLFSFSIKIYLFFTMRMIALSALFINMPNNTSPFWLFALQRSNILKIIFSVSTLFPLCFLCILLIFSLLSYHTKEHFLILVLFLCLSSYLILTIKRQVLILCFPTHNLLIPLSL